MHDTMKWLKEAAEEAEAGDCIHLDPEEVYAEVSKYVNNLTRALGLIVRNADEWNDHNVIGVARDALNRAGLNDDAKPL